MVFIGGGSKMSIEKVINPHFDDLVFNWDYKTYFLVGGYG
jgi:phage terminase large subunit